MKNSLKISHYIKQHSEQIFCILILTCLFIFGFLNLNNYGIHVDDFSLAKQGQLVTNKLVDPTNDSYATNRFMRFYSPFFEVYSHLLISYFGIIFGTLKYYLARKLIIYITFLSGLTFYYLILRKYFSFKTSVLGTASLFLIPSFFGYASVTTKEIPLISFTIISIYFLLNYFKHTNYKNLFLHGLFMGIAIAVRPSALILTPITALVILYISYKKFRSKDENHLKTLSTLILSSILLLLIIIIPSFILDPFLWNTPIENYKARLDFMTNFDMGGSIMVMGEIMKIADSRTIDMFILGFKKIPEYFILLVILGFILSIYNLFSKRLHKMSILVISFLWLLIPLGLVFMSQTKFYNFRHLLIFLPPIGIIATFAIDFLVNHKNIPIRILSTISIVAGIIISVYNIHNLFPYEVTYFNKISGGLSVNSKDYTNYPEGLAEAEAIKNLCATQDTSFKISGPFVNIYIPYYCPDKAIFVAEYEKSDFIISYDFYEKLIEIPENAELIDVITRGETSILNIYRVR